MFTFFCKATKGLLFAKAILKTFIPFLQTSKKGKRFLTFFLADEKESNITFSFCKRKVSKPYFHFLL